MKIWCLTAIGFAAALFAVGCGSDGNPSNGNNNGPDIGGQGEDIPAIVNDTVGFGVGKYDKEIREGRISVDSFYIFDKGTWRKTTPQEADGFTEISEVYANLKHDEKAVFIIRHSERTSDTGPEGHLTDNGYIYANNLGKRLAAIRKEDFYYAYSGYTRTHETCEEIAKGNGQQDYVINEQPYLYSDWFIKDEDKFSDYVTNDGGWEVFSKYAFAGAYSDAFYDLKTRSEQLFNDEILVSLPSMKRVNFMCTHDFMVEPLIAYVTGGHSIIRFYENLRWVNYLAGVAMIISRDGSVQYIPVRGLDKGSM